MKANRAISALLRLNSFRNQRKLIEQLGDAADSVPSNIGEGFGRSNRELRKFLIYARASANEVRVHLTTAETRRCIRPTTFQDLDHRYVVIGRMLTKFIQYLDRQHGGTDND
jgi:four helix bundle protein